MNIKLTGIEYPKDYGIKDIEYNRKDKIIIVECDFNIVADIEWSKGSRYNTHDINNVEIHCDKVILYLPFINVEAILTEEAIEFYNDAFGEEDGFLYDLDNVPDGISEEDLDVEGYFQDYLYIDDVEEIDGNKLKATGDDGAETLSLSFVEPFVGRSLEKMLSGKNIYYAVCFNDEYGDGYDNEYDAIEALKSMIGKALENGEKVDFDNCIVEEYTWWLLDGQGSENSEPNDYVTYRASDDPDYEEAYEEYLERE